MFECRKCSVECFSFHLRVYKAEYSLMLNAFAAVCVRNTGMYHAVVKNTMEVKRKERRDRLEVRILRILLGSPASSMLFYHNKHRGCLYRGIRPIFICLLWSI